MIVCVCVCVCVCACVCVCVCVEGTCVIAIIEVDFIEPHVNWNDMTILCFFPLTVRCGNDVTERTAADCAGGCKSYACADGSAEETYQTTGGSMEGKLEQRLA